MKKSQYPTPPGFIWNHAQDKYYHPDGRAWDSDTNTMWDKDGNVLKTTVSLPFSPEEAMRNSGMAGESVEQQIKRMGATAARVTPEDVEKSIKAEYYFTALDGVCHRSLIDHQTAGPFGEAATPLSLLTFCVLVLHNGYTVHGHSACASPANYRKDVGERVAREDAKRQIWPLLGHTLRQRLHEQGG